MCIFWCIDKYFKNLIWNQNRIIFRKLFTNLQTTEYAISTAVFATYKIKFKTTPKTSMRGITPIAS